MKNTTIKNLILSGVFVATFAFSNIAMAYNSMPFEVTLTKPVYLDLNGGSAGVNTNTAPVVVAVTAPKAIDPISKPIETTTKTATVKTAAKPVVKSATSDLPAVKTVQTEDNGLTALSLKGSGSFMPSSIWQWMLVILLILAIIILARTLTKKPAHHGDPHAAPAH